MKLKYLVTGTGRCGTVYMARFLTEIGITCGHEAVFGPKGIDDATEKLTKDSPQLATSNCSKDGDASWFDSNNVMAESSYMSAPYLDHPLLEDTKVIHLIRDPLLVLSSWFSDIHFFRSPSCTLFPQQLGYYQEFIMSHIPRINEEETEIEKTARYIIEWTKMIKNSKKEKLLVKIENYPYFSLTNFLSVENQLNLGEIEKLKNKKINSWAVREKDLTFSDIPEGQTKMEFIELYKKYYGIKLI